MANLGAVAGWVLDSGCTDHMSPTPSDFSRLTMGNGGVVQGASGLGMAVAGKGEVVLKLGGENRIVMRDVLFVPGLSQRLISVSRLQNDSVSCLFIGNSKYSCCELRRGNTLLTTVPREGHLWVLNGSSDVPTPGLAKANVAVTLVELHHKFGHASEQKLLALLDNACLPMVTLQGPRTLDNCYGCLVGKQCRTSHPSIVSSGTTHPLELVHTDLMGPISPATSGGAMYILTILCDYTRYAEVILLKHKSDVAAAWRNWWKRAEKQSGHQIKGIRCDKGTEFKNKTMDALVKEMGVQWQFTNTDTPHHASVEV